MLLCWTSLDEAVAMCRDGRITKAGNLVAVLLPAQHTNARPTAPLFCSAPDARAPWPNWNFRTAGLLEYARWRRRGECESRPLASLPP